MQRYKPPPRGHRLLFRPCRRLPNGRLLWARQYGYKAWPLLVKDD